MENSWKFYGRFEEEVRIMMNIFWIVLITVFGVANLITPIPNVFGWIVVFGLMEILSNVGIALAGLLLAKKKLADTNCKILEAQYLAGVFDEKLKKE